MPRTRARQEDEKEEKENEGENDDERNRREEKEDAVRGAVARDAQTARGCAKLRPAC